jgi:hypothetical protein
LRDGERQVHQVDGFERASHVIVVDTCLRKKEAHLRSFLRRLVKERFHEDPRVTAPPHGRFNTDGANAADARRSPVEYSRQVVLLCSSEDRLAVDKCKRPLAPAAPRRFQGGRVKPTVRWSIQAVAQGPTGHVTGTVENGFSSGNHRRRVIASSVRPQSLATCRAI